MRLVDVVIDNKGDNTDTFYTYKTDLDVKIGSKVNIPFARRKKLAEGYVFDVDVKTDLPEEKIRKIDSVDESKSLNEEMIDTAKWMRIRYGTKYIDAVKMFSVGGKKEKGEKTFRITSPKTGEVELTEEQRVASSEIERSIESEEQNVFLLKGVTNSGKTEVYMQAVAKAISMGRTAIVLVPEIALSAQMEKRFRARFGEDMVAVMHSKLTTSKRLSEWLRLKRGEARIAVGARTAIFAPLENIGVVIIDEEHETTYKSDHNPKYETVDIAYRRSSWYGATVVLGSATPSVVSYYRAGTGLYHLLEMKHRIGESRMPQVSLVDMKKELRNGNPGLISGELRDETAKALERGEQVIYFLNRRGFSTQIICPECGHRFVCDDCGITLTYHKSDNALVCHYCGKKRPVPRECPECGCRELKYVGAGTEKVEEAAARIFSDYSVDRFDLDTAKNQKEINKTLSEFRKGNTNILVGTQILAKGLDFRNVGLVGIILADTSLNIPDYRSAERTFQLITQVSGRAGRGSAESRVIIQTYEPDNTTILAAARGDYEGFYKDELLHRKIMYYPPYSDIIAVSFVERKANKCSSGTAMACANEFREWLLSLRDAPEEASILKPHESSRRMVDERERVYFIIKAPKGSRAGYIYEYMKYREYMNKSKSPCYIEIDVNPYGIM